VRALATSTYVPTFLAELGLGAMLPLFALSVLRMDHSAAVAAASAVIYAGGRMGGSAWGGSLSARLGPVRAALVGLAALAGGAVVCAVSPVLVPFLAGVALIGFGHAGYHVARQGQVESLVLAVFRARALTTLAGTWRIANFIGPLLGAAVIAAWGLRAAYAFAALTVVAAIVALRASSSWRRRPPRPARSELRHLDVIRSSWPILRTLGLAVLLTGAVRAARIVVIPLWAESIGMSDSAVSLIFAVSAGVDMLLFYPAGAVMDRWGRAWTAVPSTLLIAAGTLLLPFTSGPTGVAIAAVLLGVGNGWGSGVLMTLGADVAPVHGRDVFIGTWMILQDAGGLAGPALISGLAAMTLSTGFFVVGGLGIVTAGALWRWIPPWRPERHLPHAVD